MNWQWIDQTVILAIHARQIAEHGGGAGIRDAGLLESALGRPKNLAAYGDPDVFELAAAYAYGLAKNHAFVDGNKRTAYVATRLFLEINGKSLTAKQADKVRVFEELAAGSISEPELAAWLRDNSTAID